jgi:ribosomal protein L11 methyltransferase
MDWMEITVLTTTAAADMVSQILIDAGSDGTMIEDKNDVAINQRPEGQWDIIDEAIAQRIGDDVKVTGYYEVDASLNDKVRMIEGEIRRIKGLDLGFDAGKLELVQKTYPTCGINFSLLPYKTQYPNIAERYGKHA